MAQFLHTQGLAKPFRPKPLAVAAATVLALYSASGWAQNSAPPALTNYEAGDDATASGGIFITINDSNTAVGPKASTKSEGVGPNTVVTTRATAIGADSRAKEDGSVALGAGSFANEANTVSVGSVGGQRGGGDTTETQAFTRRITNVGDGTKATDAATVGQVNSIVTVNKGANNQATGTVALKDATGTAKATVYTQAKTNELLGAKADASTVYTKGQADTAAQDKVDATVGKAAANGQAATGLFKETADNKAVIGTKADGTGVYTDINANAKAASDNKGAINTLNGTGEGSVAKAVSDAMDAAAQDATNKAGNVVTANNDGTVTLKDAAGITTKATVYTKTAADTLLDKKADASTVYTKSAADNLLKDKANSADVYTKTAADTAAQDKVDKLANGQVATNKQGVADNKAAIGTASVKDEQGNVTTQATGLTADVEGVQKKANRTRRMVRKINEHLGLGGKRGAAGKGNTDVVLSAARTVATATDETTDADAISGAALVLNSTKAAIERADGVEALAATNTETVLKGGTGTTVQTLRDQKDGNSGVNYQTTMYDANGVELTTANTPTRPNGATGTIVEGGVEKWVTDVRLGGVAAGVNANDAVNKGQLDAVTTARAAADAALGRRIDSNTRAIGGNTQGIANVTAMASMPALPVGADSGFSAGVGGFNGKKAIALGFQHRLSANTTFKVAAATGSNGKPTMGAGISYSWGGSSYNVASQTVAMQDVNAMQDRLRAQETQTMQAKSEAAQAKAEATETKAILADLLHRMADLEGRQVVSR